mmetsp:Transcript_1520/g.5384  ORF Transcript_1520/g.5384 Transcript_1520/m.5384 type:complete len:210 (-) Transcript_1520:107-736(-)
MVVLCSPLRRRARAMAASRGKQETEELIKNVEAQLNRLLTQLEDCEQLREMLDDDEYEETKAETIDQLKEFQTTLNRMVSGDSTLVDKLGGVQLAIQAAVSNAFKTPEVIKLFAKKEPGQLRERLNSMKMAVKLQKCTREEMLGQAVEILTALKQLGEEISPQEEAFLEQHRTKELEGFQRASLSLGKQGAVTVLSVAESQISAAKDKV